MSVVVNTLDVDWRSDRTIVRFNRPERKNAINVAMVEELHEVLDRLERAPTALLLTGGDDGLFVSGADVSEVIERRRTEALAAINIGAFDRIKRLPLPVVAAIDGAAIGGGAELAYAADIRVASTRAVFGQPEVRLGILAGAGGTYRLPALVGGSLANEMLLAGRMLDASEALAAGLVSRVVAPSELLDCANGVIDEIVKASPAALRLTKAAIESPAAAHPLVDVLAQALLFEDEEKDRRMRAFLDRRHR